jgi:putative ATP-dependent endonuclease of OLD family
MARVTRLTVRNYKSIGDQIAIDFPPSAPVVLVGENNAGKSNIVHALDLVLGQAWPGNHEPDDNEFHGRDRSIEVEIAVQFDPADAYGATFTEARWQYNAGRDEPIYFRVLPGLKGHVDYYVSNEIRSSCMCVVIEADRNLNYHLSYASKFTFLSRLMHRFHKALNEDVKTREELQGLFAEVRARFNQIQPFVDFTEMLQHQLGELAQGMTHRLEVDFEAYNPVNFFHALRLHANEGGQRRTLAEMGTGEQQILALSFAYAYASAFHEGVLLVVEEPEAHLHPLAQQWLAKKLAEMCMGGLQVVLTTHSGHFLDVLQLPGIGLVRKHNGRTHLKQLTIDMLIHHCIETGAPADRTTVENI